MYAPSLKDYIVNMLQNKLLLDNLNSFLKNYNLNIIFFLFLTIVVEFFIL